ncbi:glycosyltransferase [Methylocella sp.]|uniref:glycosyltransferase n=1 Tax=Methylocella sp. TaxID=1978226 RepID=UPI003785254F
MIIDIDKLAPTFIAVGLLVALPGLLGRGSKLARALAAGLCAFLSLRYVWWHGTRGMPLGQTPLQQAWAWTFYFFESMAILSSVTVYFFLSRTLDRSAEADAHRRSPLHDAPVDVFIATYNESYDILERTIVGATHIDHKDLRVWVLDDGARPWVEELAQELGALYVRRVKGKHAKAGNVNNGLKHALSTGRRPDFILLLDADFVASRAILKRTLGLFDTPDVGIVQTPQHFFNPDPVQSNLLCSQVWPDEQRFFFESLLPAKDAWGAAFCCGTSAVFRVEALEKAGGLATETVTEDMLTSFKFDEYGYRTILLNEPLSVGLAPEGLQDYISQRGRWCLGAIQQIYTRYSFAGRAKMRFINRVSSFDGAMYWMFSFPFKLMMITAPMVYWWTGTAVIDSAELLPYVGPSAVGGVVFMSLFTRNRVMPIMTDVTQLLSTTTIMLTVASGLVRPWGRPFKVTAKGVSTEGVTVQWAHLLPFALMIAGTLTGMLANISVFSGLHGTQGYAVNVFWSVYNIFFLTLAVAVCVELPRRRRDERFCADERALIRWSGGGQSPCRLVDVSLGGALVDGLRFMPRDASGALSLDGGAIELAFEPVRVKGEDGLALRFTPDAATRRALILKLFSGANRNKVDEISAPRVLFALGRRLLG